MEVAPRGRIYSLQMPGVWRSNTYILVSFPIGGITFVYFVTMLSLGVGLLIIWLGIPVLVATVASTRFFARGERRRAGWLLREPILSLYLPQHRRGMLGYLHTAIGDSAVWKDLLWLVVLLPVFGLTSFILAITFWATALGMISLPIWSWSIPGGIDFGLFNVDTVHEAFAIIPLGLVLFAITVPFTRALALGMGSFGKSLLGPQRAPPRRGARAHARRRRRRPGRRAAADRARPPRRRAGAARRARHGSRHGAGEARHRPRGRPGADHRRPQRGQEGDRRAARPQPRHLPGDPHRPRARAGAVEHRRRNPVEVALDVDVDGRLPAATEAAAYFVTVEALTNVAKHSGAAHARVRIQHKADWLRVEISDDGEAAPTPTAPA